MSDGTPSSADTTIMFCSIKTKKEEFSEIVFSGFQEPLSLTSHSENFDLVLASCGQCARVVWAGNIWLTTV